MGIPFSLPLIDDDVIAEVNDALTNTGWLTTGPKVRLLEAEMCSDEERSSEQRLDWDEQKPAFLHQGIQQFQDKKEYHQFSWQYSLKM